MPASRLVLTLLGLVGGVTTLLGGEDARELHPGLRYVPLAEVSTAAPTTAWVLDARQAATAPPPAAAVTDLLRHPAQPLLVLLDATSPAWLLTLLAEPSPLRLTLASADTGGPVDIPVATTPAADAKARLALGERADFDAALGRLAAKHRRDQATLNGRHNPVHSTASSAPAALAEPTAGETPDRELVPPDLVLQRAVQVHAGLKALGRW